MLRRAFSCILLSIFTGGILRSTESVSIKAVRIDPAMAALSSEELVDRLQNEAPGAPNHRWPALVPAFLPLDAPPRFEQNLAPDARSPVMTELVRRGVDAIPVLLFHLTDGRTTQLVEFHQPNMMNDGGTWFSDTYDARQPGTSYGVPGVNHDVDFKSSRSLPAGASYIVKVGDLCFVALGQIVNRQLLLLGSVTKDGVLWVRSASLRSPIEFPALATAARKDWAGLTSIEHRHQLEIEAWGNDALSINSRSYGAIERLLFYYPEDGSRVAEALLNRTLVDSSALYSIATQLQDAAAVQRLSIGIRYKLTHSTAENDALLHLLVRDSQRAGTHPEIVERRRRAHDALYAIFPDNATAPTDHIDEVTYNDQATLVDQLAPFSWPGLDDALFALFTRATKEKRRGGDERFWHDQLALACAKRLVNSAHAQHCAIFIRDEIRNLSADLSADRNDTDYSEWLTNAKKLLSEAPTMQKSPL